MPKVSATTWIGSEGAAFERVSRAFVLYGYTSPRPDTAGGSGAYARNISDQYRTSLTERQVYAICEYALTYTLESLMMLQPGDWSDEDIPAGPGRPRRYDKARARLTLELPEELVAAIDDRTPSGGRTLWIEQAIRERLDRDA